MSVDLSLSASSGKDKASIAASSTLSKICEGTHRPLHAHAPCACMPRMDVESAGNTTLQCGMSLKLLSNRCPWDEQCTWATTSACFKAVRAFAGSASSPAENISNEVRANAAVPTVLVFRTSEQPLVNRTHPMPSRLNAARAIGSYCAFFARRRLSRLASGGPSVGAVARWLRKEIVPSSERRRCHVTPSTWARPRERGAPSFHAPTTVVLGASARLPC
jgi:hypothetical protein